MTRLTLNRQINHLQDEILLLGSMVEQATLDVVEALKNRDLIAANRIYENDQTINEKRFAIENAILILIATQQPIAHDLRLLAAMLEVINELERMGDYAKGIAKVIKMLGNSAIDIPFRDIKHMAELGISMLHRSLGAFISENSNVAVEIPREDDEVDNLYNKVYHTIVNAMIADPRLIDQYSLILWIVHNLERLADRSTNICERTVFIATGELLEMDSPEDDAPYE
jgi:phosphate transport system protein